jgi:hypothetical protein
MTDLTDKMRTCAAYLLSDLNQSSPATRDAVDLLLEASNALEAIPPPLGEPMEIIPPVAVKPAVLPDMAQSSLPRATWTTNAADLPPVPSGPPSVRPNRVCPSCDSRAHKRVYREGSRIFLSCPVCATAWEYRP